MLGYVLLVYEDCGFAYFLYAIGELLLPFILLLFILLLLLLLLFVLVLVMLFLKLLLLL